MELRIEIYSISLHTKKTQPKNIAQLLQIMVQIKARNSKDSLINQNSIIKYPIMFLLNLFNKNSQQNQDEKYDKITFKIDLNDNVPKYEDWSEHDYIEDEELTPKHPLYHQIFPKEEEKYQEYITTQNDTVMGIAMKLDISEKLIRSINNISDSIYPNMKLKLPQGTDLSKLHQEPEQESSKIKITQILRPSEKGQQLINYKYLVFYNAGPTGIIKGNLTINSNYLIFNPALDDQSNIEKYTVQRLLKFNAIVETVDIQDASYMQIPQMTQDQIPKKSAIVQFMLYRVGNSKIQKKFKERLKQLKLDHKAIASMTFKICESKQKSAEQNGKDLVEKVRVILQKNEENEQPEEGEEKNRLTNIPFYDIIHQNIEVKGQNDKKQEKETGKVINPNTVLGNLSEISDVLTNEQFGGLIKSMPVLYQLYSWVKVYSTTRDGRSFTNFLSKCKSIEPAVLLIKQYKGYKFGAFLIESLQLGKTGRGEMFIFTFKETSKPEIYMWTGNNQYFVLCQKQLGVGIGMGFKHGIFIKNDLDKGSSSYTHTFGNNTMLSKKQDFYIDQIELWGIDLSY